MRNSTFPGNITESQLICPNSSVNVKLCLSIWIRSYISMNSDVSAFKHIGFTRHYLSRSRGNASECCNCIMMKQPTNELFEVYWVVLSLLAFKIVISAPLLFSAYMIFVLDAKFLTSIWYCHSVQAMQDKLFDLLWT